MTRLVTILAAMGLFLLAGCEMNWKNPFDRTKTPAEDTSPADSADADAGDSAMVLEGHNLNVRIDGMPTHPGQKAGSRQIWTADPVSNTPTILFMMNESELGVFQKASLTIEPTVDGAEIEGDAWIYTGGQAIQPGKPIRLDRFTHVADGKAMIDQEILDAGTYRIGLRVQGEKAWDLQYIDLTVR